MINAMPDACLAIADWLEHHNGAVTAIATIFIAIFTIVLACVTRKQARLTKHITNLARAEFLSTHRPKIMVRRFRMTDAKITSIESFKHARGKYPSVSLSVPGVSVYVAGCIGYKDDIGITRTTAFLRQLNHSNHRFSAVGDDDYEYQD